MKKTCLSFGLFLVSFCSLSGMASAKSSLAYRHIVVDGEGEESKSNCEATRKSFGEIFQTAYKLDAVLTSCEGYFGESHWAIIFAFDSSETEVEIPVILKGETWKDLLTYHVTRFVQESRTYTYNAWNGFSWETRTRVYAIDVPVTESVNGEFRSAEECNEVVANYLSERQALDAAQVVGAKCMQNDNQWSVNILKFE